MDEYMYITHVFNLICLCLEKRNQNWEKGSTMYLMLFRKKKAGILPIDL